MSIMHYLLFDLCSPTHIANNTGSHPVTYGLSGRDEQEPMAIGGSVPIDVWPIFEAFVRGYPHKYGQKYDTKPPLNRILKISH